MFVSTLVRLSGRVVVRRCCKRRRLCVVCRFVLMCRTVVLIGRFRILGAVRIRVRLRRIRRLRLWVRRRRSMLSLRIICRLRVLCLVRLLWVCRRCGRVIVVCGIGVILIIVRLLRDRVLRFIGLLLVRCWCSVRVLFMIVLRRSRMRSLVGLVM